jgi:hypothetical protein
VKKPSESKGEWDIYKVVQTIPAEKAFRPLEEGNCPLVKKLSTRPADIQIDLHEIEIF